MMNWDPFRKRHAPWYSRHMLPKQRYDTSCHPYGADTKTGNQLEKPAKRRRQHEPSEIIITPYKRKPSISAESYVANPPLNVERVKRMNALWMISCYLQPNIPVWRGWNSLVFEDTLPQPAGSRLYNTYWKHRTSTNSTRYFPRNPQDLTEGSRWMWGEVCNCSLWLGCCQASPPDPGTRVPQINVFICFGAFHIAMAYFGSLRYILENLKTSQSKNPMTLSEILTRHMVIPIK